MSEHSLRIVVRLIREPRAPKKVFRFAKRRLKVEHQSVEAYSIDKTEHERNYTDVIVTAAITRPLSPSERQAILRGSGIQYEAAWVAQVIVMAVEEHELQSA